MDEYDVREEEPMKRAFAYGFAALCARRV